MFGFGYNPLDYIGSSHLMMAYRNHCITSKFLNVQQSIHMINVEESDDETVILISYQFKDNVLVSITVWERKHGELFPNRNASLQVSPELFYDRNDHYFHYYGGSISESSYSQVIEKNQWGIVKDHYKGTPGYRDEQDTEFTYDSKGRVTMIRVFDLYPRRSLVQESTFEYNEKGDVIRYKNRSDLGRSETTVKYDKHDYRGNWIHRVVLRDSGKAPLHAWREIIYSDDKKRIEQINRWIEGTPPSPSIEEMPIDASSIIEPIECDENDIRINSLRNSSPLVSDDSELPF